MKLGGLEMWNFFFSSDVSFVFFSFLKQILYKMAFHLVCGIFSCFDKGTRWLSLFYLALF